MNQISNITNLIMAAGVGTPFSVELPSAWIGHIPFGHWIIKKMKPDVFVELGTHWGHSYFSMCEALTNYTKKTKFYAVDTWSGDAQAGIYTEEVFDFVKKANEKYSDFSSLMRKPFDEANNLFQKQSIDLLHIDGLHTYEAVKNDFDTWITNVKKGGVIMLHDTTVFKEGFGVCKLWDEIKQKFPYRLEMTHCNGLGVIFQVDEESASPWMKAGSFENKMLQKYFEGTGRALMERVELEKIEVLLQSRDGNNSKNSKLLLIKKRLKNSMAYIKHLRASFFQKNI